jgi:hypothetical protein
MVHAGSQDISGLRCSRQQQDSKQARHAQTPA